MSHDDQLQKAVLAELNWEPSITASHIGVTAQNGTVKLTGTVSSWPDRRTAALTAWGAPGTKSVENDLIVA